MTGRQKEIEKAMNIVASKGANYDPKAKMDQKKTKYKVIGLLQT